MQCCLRLHRPVTARAPRLAVRTEGVRLSTNPAIDHDERGTSERAGTVSLEPEEASSKGVARLVFPQSAVAAYDSSRAIPTQRDGVVLAPSTARRVKLMRKDARRSRFRYSVTSEKRDLHDRRNNQVAKFQR